ncbi:MAG TPA: GTP 3',8-cyclase MoaA [Longilinea sp.]|nr:GTP 3',8-cyclase MoaA [Longilinea sp.]
MLIDSFGRQITYLRISVTDRCNSRCVYCLPPEGVQWKTHDEILRYEEIAEVVRILAGEGVHAVRLTGGEPLVRPHLPVLVEMLAAIPGIDDISLTTNGLLLEQQAAALAKAGLKRINVSLDTMKPELFRRITRVGDLERVMRGLETAEKFGLTPIKINMVVMRGINDDEIVAMARLSLTHSWDVRFIELMPIGNQTPWGDGFPAPASMYYPIREIRNQLEPLGLDVVQGKSGNGPAQEYRLHNGMGRIGLIAAIGEAFCGTCNRLRLTADGFLRPCLMSNWEINIKEALRTGQPILPSIQQTVAAKPLGHELASQPAPQGRCMMQIGG